MFYDEDDEYEDDEYEDDEDDEYEDDEYEDEDDDGGGPSKKPLLIVGCLGLLVLIGIGVTMLIVTRNGDDDDTPEPTATQVVEDDPLGDLLGGEMDLSMLGTLGDDDTPDIGKPTPSVKPTPGQFDLGLDTPEPVTASRTPEPITYGSTTPEPPTYERTPEPTPEPTAERTPEPTPEPTAERTPEPTPEPTAERTPEPTPEPTAERTPEPTPEPTAERTPEPTPEPTPEATPEPTPEATPEPDADMSYEREYLASLTGKAGGGTLSTAEIAHLKAAPSGDSNYLRAMALLAAHYEAKRDYKGHCDVTNGVLGQGRYKFNPEWTLEGAKCSLRNGLLDKAITQADTTIAYQSDMTGSNKSKRILLAYQIKAKARTATYESDAKKNAGFGDEGLLNRAVSAWREVKNYGQGVGNSRAVEQANREIEDLDARRAPKD